MKMGLSTTFSMRDVPEELIDILRGTAWEELFADWSD